MDVLITFTVVIISHCVCVCVYNIYINIYILYKIIALHTLKTMLHCLNIKFLFLNHISMKLGK